MPVTVNFHYDREIRFASSHKLLRTADGDTPFIEQPVRMVSCDTPEKSGYAGKPVTAQPKLERCRQRLQNGYYGALPSDLRQYLIKKLTPDAAEKHIQAGQDASFFFDGVLEQRLTKPNGKKRSVAVIPTGEIIDRYGRLLAYIAPWFSGSGDDPLPPKNSPERRTLNLDMIESGWAAFFPIYPSLPSNEDMNRAIAAAEDAWKKKRGAWKKYGKDVLVGYEYRLCVKLGTATNASAGVEEAFQRYCVDLRSLKVVGKFGFNKVPPSLRLWVWAKDLKKAKKDLGLNG